MYISINYLLVLTQQSIFLIKFEQNKNRNINELIKFVKNSNLLSCKLK